ncbi:MAG: CBS domain-containing protein [Planctomycetes bacterium]|nr:CBS domain-containing protein [Planctomycetota bacterium]
MRRYFAAIHSPASSAEKALFNEKLRFLKRAEPLVVDGKTPLEAVLAKMRQARAGGVLVANGPSNRPLAGIFTERDYLDKIAGNPIDQGRPIEQFMTPQPKILSPDHTIGDAIRFMTEGGYRHVPVLEKDGRIFGLVSVRDLIEFIAEHFPEEIYNLPPLLHQRIRTQEGG